MGYLVGLGWLHLADLAWMGQLRQPQQLLPPQLPRLVGWQLGLRGIRLPQQKQLDDAGRR